MEGIAIKIICCLGAALLLACAASLLLIKRFIHGRSDALLVVMGAVGRGRKAKILHGGVTFVWPVIQSYDWLPLRPISVKLQLRDALSKENIRVTVPCTFIVAVDSENAVTQETAAIRILDLVRNADRLEEFVQDIVFGQMRGVIASMPISDLNGDRQKFIDEVTANVSAELSKVGMKLITVNISNISDDAHYIENIGKKAAAEADAVAQKAIADQVRNREIGIAAARAEQRKSVSGSELDAARTENANSAEIARSEAEAARIRQEAAAENASKAAVTCAEADMRAKTAQAVNEKKIYEAQREAADAEREKNIAVMLAATKAEAEKQILIEEAAGRAAGAREREQLKARAEGLREILQAQADGIRKIVEAAGGDAGAALMLQLSDKVPGILEEFARMSATRRIDKLICIDANGTGGGSLNAMTNGMLSVMPQITEIFRTFIGRDAAESASSKEVLPPQKKGGRSDGGGKS